MFHQDAAMTQHLQRNFDNHLWRQLPDAVVQEILRAVTELRYGSVQIVVHDGKVVQIERLEKIRLERTP